MSSKPPTLDVSNEQWQLISNILQQHLPNREIWAFGSRVKGTAKPYSDLDLAVVGDQPLSLDASARLNDAFSESDLPWKVDVIDWASISDEFRKIIARDKLELQTPG